MLDPSRSPLGLQSTAASPKPSRRSSVGPQEIREALSGSQLSGNGATSPSRLSIASNMSEVLMADMQTFSIDMPPDTPTLDRLSD